MSDPALGMDLLHQGQEGGIKTDHLILGVIQDPENLLGMQARVDGVKDPTGSTDSVVKLQVPIAIPGHAGHAGRGRQRQRVECVGNTPRSRPDIFPGAAVKIALHPPGDHLHIAVVPFCRLDQ